VLWTDTFQFFYCINCDTVSWTDMLQYYQRIETYLSTTLYQNTVKELKHICPRHCITINTVKEFQFCYSILIVSWTDMLQFFDSIVIQCRGQIFFNTFTVLWYSVHDTVSQYCKIIETYMSKTLYHNTVKELKHICPRHWITIL
jgi:hypothetical protein